MAADIIKFSPMAESMKNRKQAEIRMRKLQAVRRVTQCTKCSQKCEKCGTHAQDDEEPISDIPLPYKFCVACAEEYVDYINRLKGQGDIDCYWRNDIWLEAWTEWINYQATLDRYMKSKEFIQLIHELNRTGPEE